MLVWSRGRSKNSKPISPPLSVANVATKTHAVLKSSAMGRIMA